MMATIARLARAAIGSEDDLIVKVVIPFFAILGYTDSSYELKYPVDGYRTHRRGRKPEADCVFFEGLPHGPDTSLLVAEIKRPDQESPENQARFYAANLFVPCYVAWANRSFEVWQLSNFRAPTLIGRYDLRSMSSRDLASLRDLLSPKSLTVFCKQNEIKLLTIDDRTRATEYEYRCSLAYNLRIFKPFDFPIVRDLDRQYVPLNLVEATPLRTRRNALTTLEHDHLERLDAATTYVGHRGVLKIYHRDSPASMSILEEATNSTEIPMMGVFNNLVLYKQDVAQNSLQSIIPDLATDWAWNEDGSELSFRLREGAKWHDGHPFTANDVKCTWDLLLGKSQEKLRANPRKAWYQNVETVTADADLTATFHLKRPQPAIIALLASGYAPVYPCHVPPRDMRQHPIGTGPFKFVEFKPNEYIKVARNPDYWKRDRPYLDGIEYTVIPNRSTAILSFIAGKFDMTFPFEVTVPLLRDVKSQAPQAICELVPANAYANLITNRDAPPFDNPEMRRALALALDRKTFIDILTEGHGDIGGAMQPPPEGVWGMPPDMLATLPGYDPNVQKNRTEARGIMEKLGYGPAKRLEVKVSERNIAIFRDPAVILIDQLKEIYIDGELDPIETANWFPKIYRKDYQIGLNLTGVGVDDPDAQFYENYACGSQRNYTGYCNPELQKMFEQQSMETDQEKRKQLVWEIDRRLQEDQARPIVYHLRFATCWQPRVKGLRMMVNSVFNGWRFEDVWLDE
jgi:peptide/nickel transport system substrate-binding protein